MAANSAQKKRLDDLEKGAEGIRREFDQFFMGLQRRAPTTTQAQFAGQMRKIKEEELGDWNTQDRFRFNQIHQRFVSMERIWARTMKQIEDGTYKRDKMKQGLRKKAEEEAKKANGTQVGESPDLTQQRAPSQQADALDSIDVDMGSFDEDSMPGLAPPNGAPAAPRPVAPRPAPVAAKPVAPSSPSSSSSGGAGPAGGPSDVQLQKLYKVYMDAKKRTGEASNLSFEALRAQIAKQVPTIRQKHNCEAVDFKVVLKDGKAMLKAIPK
ncbi:MAG: MXAN_5187 C-terminal domain-containing protein [Deltaproteobacteria bacterium]|nr:MXAN_5187 C-terminal domain-containing protein [Deltaproteobacteria bacterium]